MLRKLVTIIEMSVLVFKCIVARFVFVEKDCRKPLKISKCYSIYV